MSVWGEIQRDNKRAALRETWGHLAPDNNVSYKGVIQIYNSPYNEGCGFDFTFEGLSDSPWLYDYIERLIGSWHLPYYGVWEIRGVFRNYSVNATPKLILKGISSDLVSDPSRVITKRELDENKKFTGWEIITTQTKVSNGKPMKKDKVNVTVDVCRKFNQKLFDFHNNKNLVK